MARTALGRIGAAWAIASLTYLFCSAKKRIAIAVATLALVTVGTILITAPGAAAPVDPFSQEGNFGCWLDRTLTGGHTYRPLFLRACAFARVPSKHRWRLSRLHVCTLKCFGSNS